MSARRKIRRALIAYPQVSQNVSISSYKHLRLPRKSVVNASDYTQFFIVSLYYRFSNFFFHKFLFLQYIAALFG